MIKIIGLTGPTGSGKTTFCRIAEEFGIKSIDTDKVYHDLLVPPSACVDELTVEFGSSILTEDGYLDRPALAAIVFDEADCDKVKLKRLGEITHKFVLAKTREMIKEVETAGDRAIIVDAPALYESGFDSECDLTICLLASPTLRKHRIIDRDSLSDDKADSRIRGQHSDDFYSSRAAYVVVNDGDLNSLRRELESVLAAEKLI